MKRWDCSEIELGRRSRVRRKCLHKLRVYPFGDLSGDFLECAHGSFLATNCFGCLVSTFQFTGDPLVAEINQRFQVLIFNLPAAKIVQIIARLVTW